MPETFKISDPDLPDADVVEIVYAKHNDGWRLWINVDGRNRFRAYRIKELHLRVDPADVPRSSPLPPK